MIKNEMMGSLAIKKKKDLDAKSISGLTALIFAADSIRQAEIVGESMATASVEFLVDQCRIVADIYSDDKPKNDAVSVKSLSKAFSRGDIGYDVLFENFDMIAEEVLSEMLQKMEELRNYSDTLVQAVKKKEEYDSLKK